MHTSIGTSKLQSCFMFVIFFFLHWGLNLGPSKFYANTLPLRWFFETGSQVAQAGLKLIILLPLWPKYRCVLTCLAAKLFCQINSFTLPCSCLWLLFSSYIPSHISLSLGSVADAWCKSFEVLDTLGKFFRPSNYDLLLGIYFQAHLSQSGKPVRCSGIRDFG
jgi:hypothetical protein